MFLLHIQILNNCKKSDYKANNPATGKFLLDYEC